MLTFLCATAAAVLAAVLTWLWAQARAAALAEQRRLIAEQLQQAAADLAAQRERVSALEQEKSRLETQLTAERDAHQRLLNEFKALSGEVLNQSTGEFLKLVGAAFARLHQQSSDELAQRQQAIAALVAPLRESLEKVDGKIAEIEKTRAGAYGQLSEQLKALGAAQNQLQNETARLSTALSATRTAGTWGELQLRRVVELAGMTAYCDFVEQATPEAGGRDRADLVVRLPGGQRIVVDAKAPNDAYREAASAGDEATRVAKLAEHAAKVRGHIDALGAKAYWEQFQPSPEFVVLFLPGDQFLAGALQADPTLIERAMSRKILLATPASLIALLKAAAYGWRQEAVSKNAEAIADLGRQLYDRVAGFADHLARVGKGLEAASKSYNDAVGAFSGTVLPGARKFTELGVRGVKELSEPPPIETAPREVTKRA